MSLADLARPLRIGDRFELTATARAKLRPKATSVGAIVGEGSDDNGAYWKVRFDGTPLVRFIAKAFIRAERRDQ